MSAYGMTWQDAVIAFGQIVFAVALLPSVFSGHKPSRYTSAITALMLFLFSIAYFSLGLVYGTATAIVCGVLWSILFFQGMRRA